MHPPDEDETTTPLFRVGERIISRRARGIVDDVGWSPTRSEWSYTIYRPESLRRPICVYERSDEVTRG